MDKSINELNQEYYGPIEQMALSGGKTLADITAMERSQGNILYIRAHENIFLTGHTA